MAAVREPSQDNSGILTLLGSGFRAPSPRTGGHTPHAYATEPLNSRNAQERLLGCRTFRAQAQMLEYLDQANKRIVDRSVRSLQPLPLHDDSRQQGRNLSCARDSPGADHATSGDCSAMSHQSSTTTVSRAALRERLVEYILRPFSFEVPFLFNPTPPPQVVVAPQVHPAATPPASGIFSAATTGVSSAFASILASSRRADAASNTVLAPRAPALTAPSAATPAVRQRSLSPVPERPSVGPAIGTPARPGAPSADRTLSTSAVRHESPPPAGAYAVTTQQTRFFAALSLAQFRRAVTEIPSLHQHWYEILRGGAPVRLYFDVEVEYGKEAPRDSAALRNLVWPATKRRHSRSPSPAPRLVLSQQQALSQPSPRPGGTQTSQKTSCSHRRSATPATLAAPPPSQVDLSRAAQPSGFFGLSQPQPADHVAAAAPLAAVASCWWAALPRRWHRSLEWHAECRRQRACPPWCDAAPFDPRRTRAVFRRELDAYLRTQGALASVLAHEAQQQHQQADDSQNGIPSVDGVTRGVVSLAAMYILESVPAKLDTSTEGGDSRAPTSDPSTITAATAGSVSGKFSEHYIIHLTAAHGGAHTRTPVLFMNTNDAGNFVRAFVEYLYRRAYEDKAVHAALFYHERTDAVDAQLKRWAASASGICGSAPDESADVPVSANRLFVEGCPVELYPLRCIVDVCVYTKNRMMRCVGSCKLGKSAVLRVADESDLGSLGMRNQNGGVDGAPAVDLERLLISDAVEGVFLRPDFDTRVFAGDSQDAEESQDCTHHRTGPAFVSTASVVALAGDAYHTTSVFSADDAGPTRNFATRQVVSQIGRDATAPPTRVRLTGGDAVATALPASAALVLQLQRSAAGRLPGRPANGDPSAITGQHVSIGHALLSLPGPSAPKGALLDDDLFPTVAALPLAVAAALRVLADPRRLSEATAALHIAGSRFCCAAGRHHRSNSVYWVLRPRRVVPPPLLAALATAAGHAPGPPSDDNAEQRAAGGTQEEVQGFMFRTWHCTIVQRCFDADCRGGIPGGGHAQIPPAVAAELLRLISRGEAAPAPVVCELLRCLVAALAGGIPVAAVDAALRIEASAVALAAAEDAAAVARGRSASPPPRATPKRTVFVPTATAAPSAAVPATRTPSACAAPAVRPKRTLFVDPKGQP